MREVCPNCVLLVDDDASMRDLLSMRLEQAGFEARQAEDGIDGLVKLRDELPKVIISDPQMPRMAGVEFISVVRRRFPSIPVIVLSGSVPAELSVEIKPDRWIEKSARQIPELLQAVQELARKTPDRVSLPQVVTTPVWVRPGFAGYFILTCTDCLRTFRATNTPKNKRVDRTAICPYCEARVLYLIESTQPA
jgi:CheY-like chemotaxis protein/DNA-directed RNA polymerase subunit RPC12/RpoP